MAKTREELELEGVLLQGPVVPDCLKVVSDG